MELSSRGSVSVYPHTTSVFLIVRPRYNVDRFASCVHGKIDALLQCGDQSGCLRVRAYVCVSVRVNDAKP